jgi:hypothetical protein
MRRYALPELPQSRDTLLRRVARDQCGIDRANRHASDPVGRNPRFGETMTVWSNLPQLVVGFDGSAWCAFAMTTPQVKKCLRKRCRFVVLRPPPWYFSRKFCFI